MGGVGTINHDVNAIRLPGNYARLTMRALASFPRRGPLLGSQAFTTTTPGGPNSGRTFIY